MDFQSSRNNYSVGDRLQTSESLSGFFSRMTVSNKTMERIMHQDSNLSPYDGFRIGRIDKVLNQIGLNQRKHHIIYKVSSGEFAIPMEFTGKLIFDIHPRIAYNPADQDFSRVLTLHQDFKRKDLMKEGNRPYSITYRIAALSNTHHSDLFLRKEYIEIPRIFKEFAKVMAPDPIRIPRIGGVDIVIKNHPVLDRTISSRTEFSSRMSFLEDRIMGYKGKEKDLLKALTPQEIRPIVGRYEGMLEIAGHEILVAGVAGQENGSMTLGLSNHGEEKGTVLRREKAFNRIMPINFRTKRSDFDAKLTHLKMQDKRKFGKVHLSFRQQELIDSDGFYEESEEEIKNLKEALQELKTMDISEESKLSLENVKRLIQRNFSKNPLAWWDRNKIEATLKIKEECKYEYVRYKPIQINMEDKKDMQMIIKEHINLGLIEPGISAYSSPGFLKGFPATFEGNRKCKVWKWEEIHAKGELKQVCNNLSKLAIPQDEDELVVSQTPTIIDGQLCS
ncbi:UNVERIFIED_CONTAM: movement protein [Sesamum radiatum]|uniref:Movement protein n=1 Tax=Sesamum radiatum TaxID=300843 RepID=A0AAW2P505_SESRA